MLTFSSPSASSDFVTLYKCFYCFYPFGLWYTSLEGCCYYGRYITVCSFLREIACHHAGPSGQTLTQQKHHHHLHWRDEWKSAPI